MKCTRVDLGNGCVAIMCGSRQPRKRCGVPGCGGWAAKECDYPVKRKAGKSQTCDARLCETHATKVGEDLDHCPVHVKLAAQESAP